MMTLLKVLQRLLFSACVLLLAATATAGNRVEEQYRGHTYTIYPQIGIARMAGQLQAVRSGAGGTAYIGCSITGYGSTGGSKVYCSSKFTGGDFLSCYRLNPDRQMLETVMSIKPSSYVEVRMNTDTHQCLSIDIENGSRYQ